MSFARIRRHIAELKQRDPVRFRKVTLDAVFFFVGGVIGIATATATLILSLSACGNRPRDLIDYDSVLIDTPWCIIAYVRDRDDIEVPVRVCVPNQAFCDYGRNRVRESSMIQAFLRLTAIGICEEL